MKLLYLIFFALILDLLLGDPRWIPHPVRGLGKLIGYGEVILRRLFPNHEKLAGIFLAAIVVSGTFGGSLALVFISSRLHPLLGDMVQVVLIYFSLAPRDLSAHGLRVLRELKKENIEKAREKVAMMVGRDVKQLDEKGIIRATVESIAENSVDGVIAPICFAFLGGGAAAMAYRAVNTLDSMVGFQEPPYALFGWASAKLDDLVNYLPARLTAWMMPVSGFLIGGSMVQGYRILIRDGRKHASPNAGLPEAAIAGVLGVQLRGPQWYGGVYDPAPFIGFDQRPIVRGDIVRAIGVMVISTFFLFTLLGWVRLRFVG